jgi:hypothetical protein
MTRVRIRAQQEHPKSTSGYEISVLPTHQELEVVAVDADGKETPLSVKRLELVSDAANPGPISVRLELFPDEVDIDAEAATQLALTPPERG